MGTNTVIAAFGEDHTARLTGLSKAQLSYWDRTGFFQPSFADEERRAFARIYSFKDIVSLRVLGTLKNQHGVSLPHLRDVKEKLGHLGWTGVQLYVLKKKVVWRDPDTDLPQEVVSKQLVMAMMLDVVVEDMKKAIAKLNQRDDSKIGQIDRSRYVSHNTFVIKGTRIPVHTIKRFDAAGYTVKQILAEYPDLTEIDIQAALAYEYPEAAA